MALERLTALLAFLHEAKSWNLSSVLNITAPLEIQSSPKCKARKNLRRAAYDLYVSKQIFEQRSSWDEIWISRGARDTAAAA